MAAVLGIDIGGTGIKGAPVDTDTGELLADRYRMDTPRPAKPRGVQEVLCKLRDHFEWQGQIGAAYPGVVREGTVLTAANVHKSWIGLDAAASFSKALGLPTTLVNDADAAGVAEARFGAARGVDGTVVVVTLGTGIGTAVISKGRLLPNTELGHLDLAGIEAEVWASARVREDEGLSWKKWGQRLTVYFAELERLLWPDLFVVGGGVSKRFAKFSPHLEVETPITPALMRNQAGIVGAAISALT